jgi:hypothetical protein
MSQLEVIDLASLSTVTGGGSSTASAQLGVQLPIKGGQINVGGQGNASLTDYAACAGLVSKMPGARPADIRESCGLPPVAPPTATAATGG